jgi:hypothetical protein
MDPYILFSPTKIQRVNEEFARILVSIEDFAAIQFHDATFELSRGAHLSSELRKLQRSYEMSITTLQSILHVLAIRKKAARRTLRTQPALPPFECGSLSKLETDIASARQLLNNTELNDLEVLTRNERREVEALERRNALRRSNLTFTSDSSPVIPTSFGSPRSFGLLKSSVTLLPGASVSTNDVSQQIQELSESIIERKERLHRESQAIEKLKLSYRRQRVNQEEVLIHMQERIKTMELEWTEVVRIQTAIERMRDNILKETTTLSSIRRQREQIVRGNFTAVRDRRSNGEAAKRLQRLRAKYAESRRQLEATERLLKVREADYAERNFAFEQKKEEVQRYEMKVDEMENRLVTLGAIFSGIWDSHSES